MLGRHNERRIPARQSHRALNDNPVYLRGHIVGKADCPWHEVWLGFEDKNGTEANYYLTSDQANAVGNLRKRSSMS